MDSKKPLDINSLMSPPEPIPYECFTQGGTPLDAGSRAVTHEKPSMPMSPPVSPFSKGSDSMTLMQTPTSISIKDPILYPGQDVSSSPPQPPLFSSPELVEHRRIVNQHVAARSALLFREASPPPPEDYELALYFKSQVMKRYVENRRAWLRKERELLVADRKAGAQRIQSRLPILLPAKTTSIKAPRQGRPERVIKPHIPRPIRTNPTPTQVTIRVSATPEPRRIVAPNREDKDFNSLPDYCPPPSSLPDRPNSLKVDWKGAPIDLSNDPNVSLLHPDEVSLAANLRLDCATYLTSKRRIFVRRLECARVGKEFRKTDAQQACKIDVNKASKLWTAFEKVGWLELRWIQRFMG
jgi:hypothetical protein